MGEDKFLAKLGRLAGVMLAAAGGLCLLILLYFLYEYGWTGQRQFASWFGVVIHYAIPALCAAVLFVSIRLPPVARVNLALAIYSVGFAVFLLEVLASVWFKLPSVTESELQKVLANAAAAQGRPFDTRSEMQFIRDLRSRGIDAGPSIYPQGLLRKSGDAFESVISLNGTEVLPIASISNRMTVACNETGEFLAYRSDEHGFNNPPGLWQDGPVEIVALGDSFVHGFCVPPEKNFVSEIRQRYPATLSLGIEGNGPLVMLASLREYAASLKPRIVLWFYYEGNDEKDLNIEKQSPLLRRYLTRGFRQGLMDQQAQIDEALTNFTEPFVEKSDLSIEELSEMSGSFSLPRALFDVLRLSALRTRLGPYLDVAGAGGSASRKLSPREQEFFSLLNDILVEAKNSTEEWGGRVYFVYLPDWRSYKFPNDPHPYRGRVLETAKQVGLPIIDIHEVFQAHSDPLSLFPFRLPRHYTEEGHRLVAQEVLRALQKQLGSNQPLSRVLENSDQDGFREHSRTVE